MQIYYYIHTLSVDVSYLLSAKYFNDLIGFKKNVGYIAVILKDKLKVHALLYIKEQFYSLFVRFITYNDLLPPNSHVPFSVLSDVLLCISVNNAPFQYIL